MSNIQLATITPYKPGSIATLEPVEIVITRESKHTVSITIIDNRTKELIQHLGTQKLRIGNTVTATLFTALCERIPEST